jgi:hypothetical protein
MTGRWLLPPDHPYHHALEIAAELDRQDPFKMTDEQLAAHGWKRSVVHTDGLTITCYKQGSDPELSEFSVPPKKSSAGRPA